MAIKVNCTTCGKHYQAPDHMAGRRVRCRQCGTIVQLPDGPSLDESTFRARDAAGESSGGSHIHAGALIDEATIRFADDNPPARYEPPPVARDEVQEPADAGPREEDAFAEAVSRRVSDRPFESPEPEGEDPFAGGFQDEGTVVRSASAFVFPGSRFLDTWLPAILIVGCVGWLGYMTLANRNAEPEWVGPLRLFILLTAYAGIVFPVSLIGVRKAARILRRDLPSGAALRAFASFLLPITLGCVLWLSSGNVFGFVFGAAMGFVVAMPAMWLLFRVRANDAGTGMQYASGAFAIGTAAAMAVLAVLNLLVYLGMRGAKADHSLAISPFGPGFKWDAPPAPATPQKPRLAVNPDQEEAVEPTAQAVVDAPDETKPAATTDDAAKPIAPAPREGGIAANGGGTDAPVTVPPVGVPPTDAATPVPAAPLAAIDTAAPAPPSTTGTEPAATEKQFKTEYAVGAPAGAPPEQYGSVVMSVTPRFHGEILAIAYPLVPGDALAVVKRGTRANEQRVELWDTRRWQALDGVTFMNASDAGEGYQVSADGTLLTRLTDFPQLSTETYSFSQKAILSPAIKMPTDGPPPRLIGFSGTDQLVTLTANGAKSSIEVWDVNKARRLRQIPVNGLRAEPGTYAVSHDGKQIAVVVRGDATKGDGRIEVYDLATGKQTRRIVIDELKWTDETRPSGITFSENGDRIAVVFEHKGQGLFLMWGPANETLLHKHVYPSGMLPDGVNTATFKGSPLSLIDGGNAWVIYGSSVFDTQSGKLLGDLGVKRVRSQNAVGPATLLLVQEVEGGGGVLLEVRLDVGRVRRELADKR